uniref:Uncharacterized protein n=1 Tax=Arundo donax TaxID=35708 RepID=A0A0A9HE72_ARUDO
MTSTRGFAACTASAPRCMYLHPWLSAKSTTPLKARLPSAEPMKCWWYNRANE